MYDKKITEIEQELSGHLTRTPRSVWSTGLEDLVLDLAPMPAHYDVNTSQSGKPFDNYSYTEFMGGLYIKSLDAETNTRIMQSAAQRESKVDHISKLLETMQDKYVLNSLGDLDGEFPKRVCFLPGNNLYSQISIETVAKLAWEDEDLFFKPHPLTEDRHYNACFSAFIRKAQLIDKQTSGFELLKNAEEIYGTHSTELIATGVLFDKKIHDVSNFLEQVDGAYYSINRLLFKSEDPKTILNNLIDCEYSGLVFPWMDNVEERLNKFFEKSLEIREILKPLASPMYISHIKPVDKANG